MTAIVWGLVASAGAIVTPFILLGPLGYGLWLRFGGRRNNDGTEASDGA